MPKSKNNRKRKNKVYQSHQPKNPFLQRASYTYLRHMEEVGRKLLRLAGIDESFLDRMTKQQLNAILNIPSERPRVVIKKGACVPHAFLRYVRALLHVAFEETYVDNNEEIGLSMADALSYGIAFSGGLYLYPHLTHIVLGDELQAVRDAHEKLQKTGLLESKVQEQLRGIIMFPLLAISQVQFRLYGYTGSYDAQSSGCLGLTISLTSDVPECISFKHFDRRRKAYRFCMGPIDMKSMLPADIQYSQIFPLCDEKDDRKLAIYIQQHAILRLKERLRFVQPTERMMILYRSLMMTPKIVRGPDDQPLFVAHLSTGDVYGYFTFVTQQDKLFVLTFLPITSALTPEGKRLQKILHLSMKDITYLGMDSIDFLSKIDLDQIPILKDALIQSGIYRMKEISAKYLPPSIKPDEKQTAFVKKYLEEHPANIPEEPEELEIDD
ncbi:MAG: hypothetical protein LBF19_06470 [Prevotellaceae bacterium]|nr:hypothetical protein [Prevotellaceae bacterium]